MIAVMPKPNKTDKHTLTLSTQQLFSLNSILGDFMDYAHGDDRPDHGLGRLKLWREDVPHRERVRDLFRRVNDSMRRSKK